MWHVTRQCPLRRQQNFLMAEWLGWASQGHENNLMYCHDLEVMGSNPGRAELMVHSTSVKIILELKKKTQLTLKVLNF